MGLIVVSQFRLFRVAVIVTLYPVVVAVPVFVTVVLVEWQAV